MAKDSQKGALIYYFSVSNDANYFKLSFNTYKLAWRLEELYNEG